MSFAYLLPLAHTGHWVWLLYVPPVAIVIFAIVRTSIAERRQERDEHHDSATSKDRDEDKWRRSD